MRIIVGVTGASGMCYAEGFLRACEELGLETVLVISEAAKRVAQHELGGLDPLLRRVETVYGENDLDAPLASGSHPSDGMVIVPCSMKTVAALANGYTANLVSRAGDVMLKEGRRLVVVPRETPLHFVHLENLARLSKLGAVVLPAMPAFYHRPETISDLVDFISGKILDQFGVEHSLFKRWRS